MYIEITCACSIGNKVLVIGNTNVTLIARLRHCILKPMPASRHHEHAMGEATEELPLNTDQPAALLIPASYAVRRQLRWSEICV